MRFSLPNLAALFGLAVVVGGAQADGKFFGVASLARDPAMPSQSAIIRYRDGEQTMLIESSVATDGSALAWIVPVPGEVLDVSAASPGIVQTAMETIGPRVRDRSHSDSGVILLWVGVGGLAIVAWLLHQEPRRVGAAAAVITLGLSLLFLLPALATAGGAAGAAFSVSESIDAGNYDISILTGSDGDAAAEWLGSRGFALSKEARLVLDAYLKEGWSLCAAKVKPALAAAPASIAAPHPLRVRSRCAQPVYPMRLTAVGSSGLDLDLVVIADQNASARGMATWATGRATLTRYGPDDGVMANVGGITIGHPGLVSLLWPSCAVTRLHGHLDPSAMKNDLAFEFAPRGDTRASLATSATLVRDGLLYVGLGLIALFLCIPCVPRRLLTARVKSYLLGYGALLALLVFLSPRLTHTTIADSDLRIARPFWWVLSRVQRALVPRMTVEEARSELDALVADKLLRAANRDIPRGYEMLVHQRGDRLADQLGDQLGDQTESWEVRVYDDSGRPHRWVDGWAME